MKYKSQIITQASGSIGGITASHNRGGLYFRARAIPTNPATALQTVVRTALQTLSTRWGQVLTQDQRDLWAIYAENVPIVDALGDQIFITGLNWYIRANVTRIQAGFPIVDDGPTTFNTGSLSSLTIALIAPNLITVVFDDTDDWVDIDDAFLVIYTSSPKSPTINFFKGPYKQTDFVEGDSTTPPTSPAAMNSSDNFAIGQKAFFSARVSYADGRLTSAQRYSFVVVA